MPQREAKVEAAREEQLEIIDRLERGETMPRAAKAAAAAAESAPGEVALAPVVEAEVAGHGKRK